MRINDIRQAGAIACVTCILCSYIVAQNESSTTRVPYFDATALEGSSSGLAISNVFIAGSTLLNGSSRAALFTLDGRFYLDVCTYPFRQEDISAVAVNDIGQAAGYIGNRAVLCSSGTVTKIPNLPYFKNAVTSSRAVAITRAGQVIGWEASGNIYHGFLYENGSVLDLGELAPSAVNSRGTIVGKHVFTDQWHAFRTVQDNFQDLGVLRGDNASAASALNDIGVIVGSSAGPGALSQVGRPRVRGFIYTKEMRALPSLPDDYQTIPQGINNKGTIVGCGFQFDRAGNVRSQRGVVWLGGRVFDLNSLVPAGTPYIGCAYGINIRGQIIAAGAAGKSSLLLNPMPSH